MKILTAFTPAFNATSKTVDFSLMQGFVVDRLYAIINVTRNQPIYIAGAPGLGLTNIVGSKLTLSYDTSSHDNTDQLNIYYDAVNIAEDNAVKETGGNLDDINEVLSRILVELRVMNNMLKEGLNIKDELPQLRFDIYSMNDEIGNR
jgi:hypothetical protein